MIYITSMIFTLVFVIYSKWQFSDDRGETQGKWHTSGMIMRAGSILAPFLSQLRPDDWQDYFLAGVLNIILWEILINIIALKQPWNYQGKTAKWDIKLDKWEWWLYTALLSIAISVKILIK